ncbi:RAMP superfamily protein [bacterium BMS3Bbin06]|nr:RAMP superfamily protein [bacterium BMS3Bbin06]
MKVYKLFLEILTPIHIGDGSDIEPYEYVIDEQFHKIDLTKFLLNLSREDQDQFNHLLESDIIKCREFIKDRFKDKDCVVFSSEVSEEIKNLYKQKIGDPRNQLLIYPFMRGYSQPPYIPGSSLKGALRTGLIFNYTGSGKFKKEKADILEADILKCERGWLDRKHGQFITKGLDPQKDPYRCIKIVDVLLPNNSTVIGKVDTVSKREGSIQPINIQLIKETTCSEFTKKPLSIITELRFDEQLLKKNRDIKKKITIEDIINSSKAFSGKLIDYELQSYFKNHQTGKVYEKLKSIWLGLKDNEFMFRLGWGSGYNSMTINLKKLPTPKPVKTRKLIDGLMPLGWIKGKIELT